MLRRVVLTCLFALAAIACRADELNVVTVENRTGHDWQYLFVSPGDTYHWGSDILGRTGPLRDGQRITFLLDYPGDCGLFDVAAGAGSGEAWTVVGREVCDDGPLHVSLTADDVSPQEMFEPFTTLLLDNATGKVIRNLFFTPTDSGTWGVDHLQFDQDLPPGMGLRMLLPTPDGAVSYSVRAVDAEERTYSFVVDIDDEMETAAFAVTVEQVDEDGRGRLPPGEASRTRARHPAGSHAGS